MDDSNAPATKADLAATKAALTADLATLETRLNERHEILRSEMQHMHDALVERIADGETRLLQAFYTFAQSNQHRFTQVEGDTNALGARVATLETRLLEVEKRLNLPPAA
jgi:ribosomal protein L16 Arg81 hydroxylase